MVIVEGRGRGPHNIIFHCGDSISPHPSTHPFFSTITMLLSESDSDIKDNSDDDLDSSFHGIERMLKRPHISLSDCYSRDGEVDMEKYSQRRRVQILEEDWDDSENEENSSCPMPNDEGGGGSLHCQVLWCLDSGG